MAKKFVKIPVERFEEIVKALAEAEQKAVESSAKYSTDGKPNYPYQAGYLSAQCKSVANDLSIWR